jgi:acid phosphatase family membrane protein YuiD
MFWNGNLSIWAALLAWILAQTIKMAAQFRRTRHLDFSTLVSTGGMPSAHSAMASALAASVGLREGFGSSVFAVTLAFALVVMFDAQSVRRAAGQQARTLNRIVDELFHQHHLNQHRLAELLGHTRTEVFAGLLTGLGVALALHGWAARIAAAGN